MYYWVRTSVGSDWYLIFLCQFDDIEAGKSWCNRAHNSNPDSVDILCDLADIYVNDEDYDEAIKIYQQASQMDNQYQRVRSWWG